MVVPVDPPERRALRRDLPALAQENLLAIVKVNIFVSANFAHGGEYPHRRSNSNSNSSNTIIMTMIIIIASVVLIVTILIVIVSFMTTVMISCAPEASFTPARLLGDRERTLDSQAERNMQCDVL